MQGYGLQVCAVHGKKRGMQNVQEVAPGQFVCRPGMECQAGTPVQGQQSYGMPQQQQHMGQLDMSLGGLNYGVPSMNSFGGMGGMNTALGGLQPMNTLNPMTGGLVGGVGFGQVNNHFNVKEVCCIHRKERNVTSLVEVAPGAKGLRCRHDDECKMGQSQLEGTTSMVECALHGKQRSTNWLECQEDGSWRCKAESACISTVGSEKQSCSQHNKFRAVEVLQQDSNGQWTCKPGSKCKGSNIARSPGVPYARPSYTGGSICSLHNKKSGSKYLVAHSSIAGAQTCLPGNECK